MNVSDQTFIASFCNKENCLSFSYKDGNTWNMDDNMRRAILEYEFEMLEFFQSVNF